MLTHAAASTMFPITKWRQCYKAGFGYKNTHDIKLFMQAAVQAFENTISVESAEAHS
jgi:hypothetical protein